MLKCAGIALSAEPGRAPGKDRFHRLAALVSELKTELKRIARSIDCKTGVGTQMVTGDSSGLARERSKKQKAGVKTSELSTGGFNNGLK